MEAFSFETGEIIRSVFSCLEVFGCYLLVSLAIGVVMTGLMVGFLQHLYRRRKHTDDSVVMFYLSSAVVAGGWLIASLFLGIWGGALASFNQVVAERLRAENRLIPSEQLAHVIIVVGKLNQLQTQPPEVVEASIRRDLEQFDASRQLNLRQCLSDIVAMRGHVGDIVVKLGGDAQLTERLGTTLRPLETLGTWYRGFSDIPSLVQQQERNVGKGLESFMSFFLDYCEEFYDYLEEIPASEGMVAEEDFQRWQMDYVVDVQINGYLWQRFLHTLWKVLLTITVITGISFGLMLVFTKASDSPVKH